MRSRSIIGNIGAGIQSLFGGNISIYTELAEKAREEAFDLMVQHAASAGANAVIAMRYDANEITDGITEVLAYGTAVVVRAGLRGAERPACQRRRSMHVRPRRACRSVAQLARAPVSKTGGCRFESCHSCQLIPNSLAVKAARPTRCVESSDRAWTGES